MGINILQIKKVEIDLKNALEYFSESKTDEFSKEILEQASEALIILEMIRDSTNDLNDEDRNGLFEKISKVSSNMNEVIKEETSK